MRRLHGFVRECEDARLGPPPHVGGYTHGFVRLLTSAATCMAWSASFGGYE